jgi:PKD domain
MSYSSTRSREYLRSDGSGESVQSELRQFEWPADDGGVTTFPRSLPTWAGLRLAAATHGSLRRLTLAFVSLALALSAGALGAAPAGAVISGNFGVQKRGAAAVSVAPLQYHGGPVLHSSDAYVIYWDPIGTYRGDWERLIDKYFHDVGAASGTLGDVFALNTQYRDGQGRAANQSTFRGSYKDEDAYPSSGGCSEPGLECLTSAQIETELQHVISSVDPPLPGATGPPVYYLLTPPGVTVCTGPGSPSTCSNSSVLEAEVAAKTTATTGICGYHSAVNIGGSSPIPYAVQPWIAGNAGFIKSILPLETFGPTTDALACQNGSELQEPNQLSGLNPFGDYAEGLADVVIGDLSVEQNNIVVDPLLNAWYQTATKAEQADVCQKDFGPPPTTPPAPNKETQAANLSNQTINGDVYYLPLAFNSSGVLAEKVVGCWSGVSLEPFFTAPNPVNSGDIVGFNATESLITLDAKANGLGPEEPYVSPVYSWNFGDGSTASGTNAASEFHSYTYGGEYDVVLSVTDGGANVGHFSEAIHVNGPQPPAPPVPATPSGSGSSAAATSAAAAGTTTGKGAPGRTTPPGATASVVSRRLSTVVKGGLVVRYSVSEQVAGRFEVLLASSIARRLGLHGPSAKGLATGTPAQTLIAKAILVTTKGGRSTYKIQFSKSTAARLRRLSKVSLLLRMVVHNASSPTTTTVLNTVKLTG